MLRRYGSARAPGAERVARRRVAACDAPEIARLVEAAVEDLQERFGHAIERGRVAGEIAASVDPVQTARVLLSLYLGMYVLVRSGAAGEPVLGAVLQQVQALLPATSVAGADE